MRLAVMGVGGVGGYFGGRLAAAGEDVAFIARGGHYDAIRRDGLRVVSPLGDLHLAPVSVTDDPAEVGPVDVVVFTVKLWDTESAALAIRPLVGPHTVVVTFQNGVDSVARIAAVLGSDHVAGGVSHISASIAAPGLIRHIGSLARLTVGSLAPAQEPVLADFRAAAQRAGIDILAASDIRRTIWEKFVFLAPFSGVTTLTRLPIGPLRADPDTRALFRAAVDEAVALARASEVALSEDYTDRVMTFVDGLPADMKSSMLGDLERNARLELPWLSGAVARQAAEKDVAAPVHSTIYAALKLYSDGPPAGR